MSALIAVCKSNCVEILTDAACVNADSGEIAVIAQKQTRVGNMVIGHHGWMYATAPFAVAVEKSGLDFDGLIERADEIWAENARRIGPADFDHGAVIAGFSQKRGEPEFRDIDSRDNRLSRPLSVVAAGATDDCAPLTNAFLKRFEDRTDAFDVKDGIALMEELRRVRRAIGGRLFPVVGGWIQHTRVSRDDIRTFCVHRWPQDRVGAPIELMEAA